VLLYGSCQFIVEIFIVAPLKFIVKNITKRRSVLKGLENCVSKYKTKHAISKIPPACLCGARRQVSIILKNNNGAAKSEPPA
jgi:hypothetical protein